MPTLPPKHLWAASILLLGFACLAAAQDEEPAKKYLLQEAPPAPGEVCVVERSEGETLEIYATPRGMEGLIPDPVKSERHLRERYLETVLALDKDGAVTQLQRAYRSARTQQTVSKLEPLKTVVHGRQGKTLTLKRVGTKTVVNVTGGKLSLAETKELSIQLDRAGVLNVLPDHEVGPDDEWDVEEARIVRAFGMEHGTLHVRFIEVKPYRGHSCARLSLDLQMGGKTPKGTISWNVEGDAFFALDLQRTLLLKFTGPVSTTGVGKYEGHVADLAGEGIGEFSLSRDLIKKGKAAAKPVDPATPPGTEPPSPAPLAPAPPR